MFAYVVRWFDRKIGIAVVTKGDAALLQRRFVALQRQLPWLYAILLASLFGLQIALWTEKSASVLPSLIMSLFIGFRSFRWIQIRTRQLKLRSIQREMRKTFVVAILLSLGFSGWTWGLLSIVSAEHIIEMVLFGSLAAMGCTYAMTGFPAGARLPLLILVIPVAGLLALTGEPVKMGIAISMTIVSGVTLRLLNAHDHTFVQLVLSNLQVTAERKRAVAAEMLAVNEQSRVQLIANSDALTGLVNRRGFLSAFDLVAAYDKRRLALMLIDLDGFKPVNDSFGHACGDALLVDVSERLRSLPLPGMVVARLGGDEFAIVWKCESARDAYAAACKAVAALGVPFSINGRTLSISACAGVSYHSTEHLIEGMRLADIALYHAKKCARGQATLFTQDMQREVQRRVSIEQALREPGIDSEIEVAFQPIFKLDTMELCSFEALARWRHSKLGWISPAEFIPITEQISVLESMSQALLRRAINAAHSWPERVRLSFNLSAIQACAAGSAEWILSTLDNQDFEPRRLQVEITETALLADFGMARENISKLRKRGVSIVLDDFGAGYSSINYLRQIHFEAVKLDGSLVTGAKDEASGLPLLRGVLALCREIGSPCIAEHIESPQELEQLQRLGCEFGQGYLLSRPLTADAALTLTGSSRITVPAKVAA